MNHLKKLFSPRAADKTVEIEFIRGVMVSGEPHEAGSTASFDAATAKALIDQGAAFDPLAEGVAAELRRGLAALIPPPGEPAPLPDSWKGLPECFSKWWQLDQQGIVLVERAEEIERRTSAKVKRYTPDFDVRDLSEIPNHSQRGELLNRVAVGIHIAAGDIPESYLAECRYLKDACVRANQSVSAWKEANAQNVLRHRLECSDAVFAAHGELSRNSKELIQTGRAIFETRIAALGLSGLKIDELFHGSADYLKFKAPAAVPNLQDIRVSWFLDNGRDQSFHIDQPVPVLAQLWTQRADQNRDLVGLLKAAKAELKKAQSVAPPGLAA